MKSGTSSFSGSSLPGESRLEDHIFQSDPARIPKVPRSVNLESLDEGAGIFDTPRTPKTPNTEYLEEDEGGEEGYGGFGGFGSDPEVNDPFPTELLPEVLRSMVAETSRVTQTPDALAAIVGLGILSASIGGGLLVKSGPARLTPANLFFLVVARSGTGKGRVFSMVSKPFQDASSRALDQWSKTSLPRIETELSIARRRAEKLVKEASSESDPHARAMLSNQVLEAEQDRQRLEKEREREPCFSVGDVTREKLAVALSGQPREAMGSFSPEARGILGVMMGRYSKGGSSDEDIYLSAYSGESYRVDRLNRPPVALSAPRLAVCWLVQPDAAKTLVGDSRMTESGLLPRFLVCDVKAEPEDEPEDFQEVDDGVVQRWGNMIRDLLEKFRDGEGAPAEIVMTPEVNGIMREFSNDCKRRIRTGGDLRDIDSYVSRWAENAIRLSLCLHVGEFGLAAVSTPIGIKQVAAAIGLVKWFAKEQIAFLSVSRTERLEKRLSRLVEILLKAGGCETLRNLAKSHGFEKDEIRLLEKRYPGAVVVRASSPKTSKGGRPSPCACIPSHQISPTK